MVAIILYQPEIPPNTGNIMRLCSNIGFALHIIKPIGFNLDEKSLRRAKMDYFANRTPNLYDSFEQFITKEEPSKIYPITKFGRKIYTEVYFKKNSYLLFGSETRGLPKEILKRYSKNTLKIPMQKENRSLNLSNAVAIVSYEAWRQLKFSGAIL